MPPAATGLSDPGLCPARAAASGYARSGHAHAGHADSGQTHGAPANSGHEHAALAQAGQEHSGGGESGHARRNASPAQENDCRCSPCSMLRCFPLTPPALLSSAAAFISPVKRAIHEPRNDIPVTSPQTDNLFRPPRAPAA
ncbi:MAG: hypothetical protein LBP38_04425 [Desulfovibrio sp.]|nr:hypothetical protein [Desulfovibrio sp.]